MLTKLGMDHRFIVGTQYVDIENNAASGPSRLFGVATTKLVDNRTNVTMRKL
jgi:hypothetical protein